MTELELKSKCESLAPAGDAVSVAVLTLFAERDAHKAKAEAWMKYADSLRCPQCTHPRGPIGKPRDIEKDGYVCVWTCPCDCHADVPALKAELERKRNRVAELEALTASLSERCAKQSELLSARACREVES